MPTSKQDGELSEHELEFISAGRPDVNADTEAEQDWYEGMMNEMSPLERWAFRGTIMLGELVVGAVSPGSAGVAGMTMGARITQYFDEDDNSSEPEYEADYGKVAAR